MGIDYGGGVTNIDLANGIRYGVINQTHVLQAWIDSSEPYFGEELEAALARRDALEEIAETLGLTDEESEELDDLYYDLDGEYEAISYSFVDGEYTAESDESGDIMIIKSPFYTLCNFCSPCAPGAGYLTSGGDVKAYCFGPDWFEENIPHDIYLVSDDTLVAKKTTED